MNKLVVLGSVNADHVLQVPSFPRPGETLYGKGYAVIPGGREQIRPSRPRVWVLMWRLLPALEMIVLGLIFVTLLKVIESMLMVL